MAKTREHVLIVDDDTNVLDAVKRMFRSDADISILTASTARDAMGILKESCIPVIVSDHHMPAMSGVEFLEWAKTEARDSIRILLTGNVDFGVALNSINRCEVYRFITKPWNADEFKATIREALQRYRMVMCLRSGDEAKLLSLVRAIELLKPRSVLEVGCGNGINLLLLAGRFPKTRFAGLDLTPEGIAAAQRMQREPVLPDYLQAFAPLPIIDTTSFRRIDFRVGDACALPFEAGGFDLVYTALALEQMERVRDQALGEIARVAGGHAFLIEPFRDVNASGLPRRYVVARDYLQARIADLPRYGLAPLWATADFPQETFLRACAVLAESA